MRRVLRPSHQLITEVSLGIVCALLLIGSAIAQTSTESSLGESASPPKAQIDFIYARSGTDFSKFKTIKLMMLGVPPEVRNGAPRGVQPELGENYILGDKEVAALQAAYRDVMHEVLGDAGFTFVDEPQADTLIVAAKITGIGLTAPLETSRMYGELINTMTRDYGAVAIAAALGDGATGTVIAEVPSSQYPSSFWKINDHIGDIADARYAFRAWAEDLRNKLTPK